MSSVWMVIALMLGQAPAVAPRGETETLPVRDGRDGVTGAVDVRNEMGKRFRLTEAILLLDDKEVAHRTAAAGRELEPAFRLWASGDAPINGSERVAIDGLLRPGEHAVTVALVYEGRNVGPFTYLDNYKYRAESSFAFTVASGNRPAAIQVVARERKGANVPPESRPVLTIEPGPASSAVPVVPRRTGDHRL
jgi:hypothetical protein